MARVKMIAVKPFTYAHRALQADESFEASPRDARVLAAIKRAKYHTTRMTASQSNPSNTVDTPSGPRRRRARSSPDGGEGNGVTAAVGTSSGSATTPAPMTGTSAPAPEAPTPSAPAPEAPAPSAPAPSTDATE